MGSRRMSSSHAFADAGRRFSGTMPIMTNLIA
ncbi:hypothetical protein COGO111638_11500 [Corynebacterium gottingense]